MISNRIMLEFHRMIEGKAADKGKEKKGGELEKERKKERKKERTKYEQNEQDKEKNRKKITKG